MSKSILIIGVGTGISLAVAEKFGKEGYAVGLISRSEDALLKARQNLSNQGISIFSTAADAGDSNQLTNAIALLKNTLGTVNVVLYNAAVMKRKDILLEDSSTLVEDFKINVGGALHSVTLLMDDLKAAHGAVIFTGGGIANYPNPLNGSLSIGKAGIRNLTFQLHQRLKEHDVYVGTLTINNRVSHDSPTHTPLVAADKIWELVQTRNNVEMAW
jgi:short-subunit dehydrogenase